MICKISGRPPVWCVFYRPECDICQNQILGDWLEISWWNSLQMLDFGDKTDWYPKKVGHVTFWYLTDRSVKYTPAPHRNKGSDCPFELKFSPEVDIVDIRWCAKFQVGRSRGSDFTDRSVFYPESPFPWQPVLSDRLEILQVTLYYQFETLVKISSR